MNLLLFWIFALFAADELVRIQGSTGNGRAILEHTNVRRKRHGCPELYLDENLSRDCENYAKQLAKSNSFAESDPTNKNYTENICRFTPASENPLVNCVKNWYRGVKYDMLDSRAKEFTAMIWRSSRLMGYGDAMLSSSEAMMVVRYTPPGNVPGLYTDNVPPREEKEKEKKKKKKRKKWRRSCSIRRATLNLLTILICQLLSSTFIN